MKKLISVLVAFVIAVSCISISAFALDDLAPGTFFTAEQAEKAQKIKEKFGFDAIFFCTEETGSLSELTQDYLATNGITEKYLILSTNDEYYYCNWSKDLDGIFHSADNSFLFESVWYDGNGIELSPQEAEDNFFELVPKTVENRINCPYKYIKDQADVLTDEQEKELDGILASFSESNNADFVVVFANGIDNGDYKNDDRMAFADDYYDYNGYAKDGTLLLVNIGAHGIYSRGNSWISTSGKCIYSVDDSDISSIGSKLTPMLISGEYFEAVKSYSSMTEKYLKQDKNEGISLVAIITIVLSIIVAFIYTGKLKKQLKSVKDATDAKDYIVDGSLNISRAYDHFLYAHVTKTARESSSSSGGSHTSSSGSSHGGGGF